MEGLRCAEEGQVGTVLGGAGLRDCRGRKDETQDFNGGGAGDPELPPRMRMGSDGGLCWSCVKEREWDLQRGVRRWRLRRC